MPILVGTLIIVAVAGLTAFLIVWISRIDAAESAEAHHAPPAGAGPHAAAPHAEAPAAAERPAEAIPG